MVRMEIWHKNKRIIGVDVDVFELIQIKEIAKKLVSTLNKKIGDEFCIKWS